MRHSALIRIRPFLNTDAPALAEIWSRQPPARALFQPMTPALLERYVFCKPYFDRTRVLLAFENELPIGFAHAAFGSSDDRSTIGRAVGVVAMLMVLPRPDRAAIAGELLKQAESSLVQSGAKRLLAGGVAPHDPFYHGLYGGCSLPGVLESDSHLVEWYREAGYRVERRLAVLRLALSGFRPQVNRQMMQVRRQFSMNSTLDPATETWWESCTIGLFDRTRFTLSSRGGPCVAAIDYADIEPLSQNWGAHAAGILHLDVDKPHRGKGLATFLLGESLRQLQSQGISAVEALVEERDELALRLFSKCGFAPVDHGLVLVRDPAAM